MKLGIGEVSFFSMANNDVYFPTVYFENLEIAFFDSVEFRSTFNTN